MSPRERLWPAHSTGFEKQARNAQSRHDFREWSAHYEPQKNGSSSALPELPRADPKAYYRTSDGILVKGVELAKGVLPVNLQPTTPSLFERVRKKWRLLFRR